MIKHEPVEGKDVLTVSMGYLHEHAGEVAAHVASGGVARAIALATGDTVFWLTARKPQGVITDEAGDARMRRAIRARVVRGRAVAREARQRQAASVREAAS